MEPLNELIEKIESGTSLTRDEISSKIKEKRASLSDLISEEGAAYLIAKDLGVNLLGNENRKLEIKNIIPGMRSVAVAGRVFRVSAVIKFTKKNGNEGRVVNIFIGDKTGFVRIPLWNEQADIIEEEIVKMNDIVQVSGAFSQENKYGDLELSLGKFGEIFNVTAESQGSDITFPTTEELSNRFLSRKNDRAQVKDITEGEHEIKATVIDVDKSNFIFNVCPTCGKKAVRDNTEGNFSCSEHGKIEPKPEMVLPFIMDDGTGIIRVVAFRNTAEKIATTTASEISKLSPEERHKLLSGSVVGKEYIIEGRVKKNMNFDRLEMIVNEVKDVNVTEESEKLLSSLKMELN